MEWLYLLTFAPFVVSPEEFPMSLINHRGSEARLLAELTARPSVALCMACLVAATGLSIADGGGELEGHGMRVDAWDARCDRCHRAAVIMAIAKS